jgi:sec-independent protein translocase protein TatC
MALSFFRRRNPGEPKAEMSFIDHLEALRGHLFRSVIAIAAGAIVVGIYNNFFVKKVLLGPTHADFPTYGIICRIGKSLNLADALCMKGLGIKMQSTSVAGQFSTWF